MEAITRKIYDDIATRPTIPNAVILYEKFSSKTNEPVTSGTGGASETVNFTVLWWTYHYFDKW